MSISEIRSEVNRQILDFHDNHVTPHGNGTLDVSMIVGAMNDTERKLWDTEKSVVNERTTFAAVGAGAMYARLLMNEMFGQMNTVSGMLFAAYVVHRTKLCIDGCDDETDLIGIRRDKSYRVEKHS